MYPGFRLAPTLQRGSPRMYFLSLCLPPLICTNQYGKVVARQWLNHAKCWDISQCRAASLTSGGITLSEGKAGCLSISVSAQSANNESGASDHCIVLSIPGEQLLQPFRAVLVYNQLTYTLAFGIFQVQIAAILKTVSYNCMYFITLNNLGGPV